jgi:hypothetical protein
MGRNVFREKVCKLDDRFASGLIRLVHHDTLDPTHLT